MTEKPNDTDPGPDAAPEGGQIEGGPRKHPLQWRRIGAGFMESYRFAIKMILSLAVVFLFFQTLISFFQDNVVFMAFDVPASLSGKGYTGKVIASHLSDKVGKIRRSVVRTDRNLSVRLSPPSEGPDIQVPGADISLQVLLTHLNILLGREKNQVTGEAVADGDELRMTVRLSGRPGETLKGTPQDIDAVLQDTAEYILKVMEPLTLARYYYWRRDYGAMAEVARFLRNNRPGHKERAVAFLIDGMILLDKRQLEDALMAFQRAASLDPSDPDAYAHQGIILDEMGRFDEAMAMFRKTLQLDPKYVSAINNWSITLFKMGDLDGAIAKTRQVIQTNPTYADAYNNWAFFLNEKGQYKEALPKIRKAVELKPDAPVYYETWGESLTGLEQYDGAVEKYRKALALDPETHSVYYAWGNTLKKMGKAEEAMEKHRKVIEMDPDGYYGQQARERIGELGPSPENDPEKKAAP
jgi:tetratricopeptide (TPR) repeat protein